MKNRRVSIMQKMTVGESLNSPLELTLSQLVLGIVAGAIGSIILSSLGIVFNQNSGIELIFMVSLFLVFIKKRFVCFSYSGAILGLISISNHKCNRYSIILKYKCSIINDIYRSFTYCRSIFSYG